MAITEWKIAKSSHTCKGCESKFEEGDLYHSVLFEEDSNFVRQDFCPECFQAQSLDKAFSHWKTSVAEDAKASNKKPALDIDSVMAFFKRLEGEKDIQKQSFRFVLALMLTRKKVLKLDGGGAGKDGEDVLIFREPRGGDKHEVVQPAMNDDEIGAVSEELGRLLGIAPPKQESKEGEKEGEGGETGEAKAEDGVEALQPVAASMSDESVAQASG